MSRAHPLRVLDYLEIANGYFDINLDVVWHTVQTALPALKTQLDALPAA